MFIFLKPIGLLKILAIKNLLISLESVFINILSCIFDLQYADIEVLLTNLSLYTFKIESFEI